MLVALAGGAVWTLNGIDQTLSRIDPRTNQVVATIDVAGLTPVQGLAVRKRR